MPFDAQKNTKPKSFAKQQTERENQIFSRSKFINNEENSDKYQKAVILKKLLVVAIEAIEPAANKH